MHIIDYKLKYNLVRQFSFLSTPFRGTVVLMFQNEKVAQEQALPAYPVPHFNFMISAVQLIQPVSCSCKHSAHHQTPRVSPPFYQW